MVRERQRTRVNHYDLLLVLDGVVVNYWRKLERKRADAAEREELRKVLLDPFQRERLLARIFSDDSSADFCEDPYCEKCN